MVITLNMPGETTAVIILDGKFTIEDVLHFRTKTTPLMYKGMKAILLCCSKLEFIDSSGIGSLILLMNTARNLNIDLVLYDMQDAIMKVFKTAFLDKFFRILPLDDVRKSFPGAGL
jgi:anti-sigma B factor antagonist